MTLPLLAILAGHTDAAPLLPLLGALRTWCQPSAPDANLGVPDAFFATSSRAIGLDAALAGPIPVAVVADSASNVTPDVRARAAAIVVRDEHSAAELGATAIVWRRDAVRASDHPSVAPFVRERWRNRLGLPSPMVIEVGGFEPSPVDSATLPAALAVCSAAVVHGPMLTTALALGAAVVTDAAAASAIGAIPFVHLAVSERRQAASVAEELATDPGRAAALGWGGRQLVEAHHDLDGVARTILDALGIGPIPFPSAPLARLDAELDALGTPPTSSVATRALRRTATVAGSGDWTDLTGRRR